MLILVDDLATTPHLIFWLVKNHVHAMRIIDGLGNVISSRTCFR